MDDVKKKRGKPVTVSQRDMMLSFFEENKYFANMPPGRGGVDRINSTHKWDELTGMLNVEPGARKTREAWKRCWMDFKYKARTTEARQLTPFQRRMLAIVGTDVDEEWEMDSNEIQLPPEAANGEVTDTAEDEDLDMAVISHERRPPKRKAANEADAKRKKLARDEEEIDFPATTEVGMLGKMDELTRELRQMKDGLLPVGAAVVKAMSAMTSALETNTRSNTMLMQVMQKVLDSQPKKKYVLRV